MSRTQADSARTDRIEVLLIDDEPDFAEMAGTYLERAEDAISVRVRTDPEQAVADVETNAFDAVLADFRMPGRDGLDLLGDVRELDPSIPFFLLTAHGSEALASKAISAGATDYFIKDTGTDQYPDIAAQIRRTVERHRSERTTADPVFGAVFESLRNGLLVVDADLEIRRANEWVRTRADADPVGQRCYALLHGRERPREDCPVQDALDSGTRQRTESEITGLGESFWAEVRIDPFAVGAVDRALVQLQDVTARKRRERKLEKREQHFRALHEQTESCLGATSRREILGEVLRSVASSFSHARVAVFAYDGSAGALVPVESTPEFESAFGVDRSIEPAQTALWTPFQEGRTAIVEATQVGSAIDGHPGPDTDFVVVPLGDYGLLVVHRHEDVSFPAIDLEMLALCGATSTAILERIRSEGELGTATERVATQRERIESLEASVRTLREFLDTASSGDRAQTERRVVSGLLETDGVDFAWVGHPDGDASELRPATWDGREAGYLDAVSLLSDGEPVPAQRAASERRAVVIDRIAERLQGAAWAKEALSMGFASAAAVPVEIDGVLYAVLSAYATEPDRFDEPLVEYLETVAALLAAQIRRQNLEQHNEAAAAVELEFAVPDPNFSLATIAARTGTSLEFELLLAADSDSVRIVCSLPAGASPGFLDAATDVAMVRAASWFGDQEGRSVVFELDRPFLGTGVAVHGGRLTSASADTAGGSVTVEVPTPTQKRPLIEWLQGTYREIEFVAKRDPSIRPARTTQALTATLTDRQAEILRAAHVGGYFENPREISGGDLAENFDISDSAVYDHLRAAQKRLLDELLDIGPEN